MSPVPQAGANPGGTPGAKPGAKPGTAAAKPAVQKPAPKKATAKGNDPPRYLKIEGSQVAKAPVHITAAYSGDMGDDVFTEFKRRYGYMDYVVLQTKDTSGGTIGRVYAWTGNSAGTNQALLAAPPGAKGTVQNASGKVLYEGEVIVKHDFEQAVPKLEVKSPDGRFTAKLCEAGFPGLNFLIVHDETSGKEVTWQAGSRSGDVYLDAQWVGNALLTYEGKPDDQVILQTHDDGHFVSEILGPDQLLQDAAAAGIDADPDTTPRVIAAEHSGDTLRYKAQYQLASGGKTERAFEGRFDIDAQGFVHLVDRKPTPPDGAPQP